MMALTLQFLVAQNDLFHLANVATVTAVTNVTVEFYGG